MVRYFWILVLALVSFHCDDDGTGGEAESEAEAEAEAESEAEAEAEAEAEGEPVGCGNLTCGADEYCLKECLCCGIPTDAGTSWDYQCVPIPDGCNADNFCECGDFSSCDPDTRTVETFCA